MDGRFHSCFHILLKCITHLDLIPFFRPLHRFSLIFLKQTLSLVMYLVSPLVSTLFFKALHIFSDDALKINACIVLCRTVKLFGRILPVSCWMSAGGLSVQVDGSFGFHPNTSWNGEKPCHEFLALRYGTLMLKTHGMVVKFMSRCCDSSDTFSIMSAMMKLCFSTSPLLVLLLWP